jgi:hypothetical protein
MKKSLLIVALALLITITPALAASTGKIFTVLGTIAAVTDAGITVAVVDANKLARPYIGDELDVNVTPSTICYEYVVDGSNVLIDCSAIAENDTVNVRGRVVNDIFYAQVITINVICPD